MSHFQGLLSLQARLLPFLVSTICQSFSLNPDTFALSSFLFPPLLHQLVQQYWWLSTFTLSCQLKLFLVYLPLLRSHTEHWYLTTLSLLHFLLLFMGRVHNIFLCVQNYSSYKGPNGLSLLHCHVISYILSELISHILLPSVQLTVLIDVVLCIVCPDGLFLCST